MDDFRLLKEASANPARAKAAFNKFGSADWQLVTTLALPSPSCPPTYSITGKRRTMKFKIPFSKSGRKSGKEKEKDTTSNNVDGVDRCVDVHEAKTSRMSSQTLQGLGRILLMS